MQNNLITFRRSTCTEKKSLVDCFRIQNQAAPIERIRSSVRPIKFNRDEP